MRRSRRVRSKKKTKIVIYSLMFWMIAGMASIFFVNLEGENFFANGTETMGKHYLSAAYPAVSRGVGFAERTSSFVPGKELEDLNGRLIASDPGVGEIRLETAEDNQKNSSAPNPEPFKEPEPVPVDSVMAKGPPKVLIYHTHATESYQPVAEGNFHSVKEECTVREAGRILKEALEDKGIAVLHDKTLHDIPSYSQSYSRSVVTAQKHLAENPSIQIVIDLHRDAAGAGGNKAYTFEVNGVSAAQFSLVIGQGNANLTQLTEFANKINERANNMYPGFARGIIEKSYRFNQYIFDQALLLELGNNQNDISQIRCSARYFADVIASVVNE
ncbi:MAG: stage II sporulation protein P [Anaerovoracaceae bacterium]|jgi:stage II sporulation protein P